MARASLPPSPHDERHAWGEWAPPGLEHVGPGGPKLGFSRRQRDLFPLPLVGLHVLDGEGVGRHAAQRNCRRVKLVVEQNESIKALNWMAGYGIDAAAVGVPSPWQAEVLDRVEGLIHLQEPCGPQLSSEASLKEMLQGRSGYQPEFGSVTLAAYQAEKLSIPGSVEDCPYLVDVAPRAL